MINEQDIFLNSHDCIKTFHYLIDQYIYIKKVSDQNHLSPNDVTSNLIIISVWE